MKINGSAIRPGMVIEYNGKIVVVTRIQIGQPGNLRAFNQVDMKDVKSGTKLNHRFSSNESVERLRLEESQYQYLYGDDEKLTFMDSATFEQIELDRDMAGDQAAFLQDGMIVSIQTYENQPIALTLPDKVTCTIVETEPTVKGQTASSSYKPAILDNGVKIQVPPFIEVGTKVVVSTGEMEYVERAK